MCAHALTHVLSCVCSNLLACSYMPALMCVCSHPGVLTYVCSHEYALICLFAHICVLMCVLSDRSSNNCTTHHLQEVHQKQERLARDLELSREQMPELLERIRPKKRERDPVSRSDQLLKILSNQCTWLRYSIANPCFGQLIALPCLHSAEIHVKSSRERWELLGYDPRVHKKNGFEVFSVPRYFGHSLWCTTTCSGGG